MPPDPQAHQHVKPFVHDTPGHKALHFSISETQSCMRLDDPDALTLAYTRTMMGVLLFEPNPRHVTMIGLGGGSLAKFCYRHLPQAQITVLEINPHVIALRDEFQVPQDDRRFRVVRADGASFVRAHPDSCDVLMVDGFDSDGLPARLSSPRFYDDCHAMLHDGGHLVVNLHFGTPRFEVLVDRMRRSFGNEPLHVDDGELSNTIVFASKGAGYKGQRRIRPGRLTPLDAAAAAQLEPAFALVDAALNEGPQR